VIGIASLAPTPVLAAGGGAALPLLAVLFVVFQVVRAAIQARAAQAKQPSEGAETDDARRAREIRERLRRVIAERRGVENRPAEPPPLPPPAPQRPPPDQAAESPVKRVWREIETALAPPPTEPRVPEYWATESARQGSAAQEPPAPRPAETPVALEPIAHLRGPDRILPDTSIAARTEARQRLLADLRDPQSVRRALVLREVLGPPISLR
jgi:hypothetical protein